MLNHAVTLLGGLHGTSPFRVFHWIFRENPMIAVILLVGIVLYLIYRYNNRR